MDPLDWCWGFCRLIRNQVITVRLVDENANAIVVESRVIPEVLARPENQGVFVGHGDG